MRSAAHCRRDHDRQGRRGLSELSSGQRGPTEQKRVAEAGEHRVSSPRDVDDLLVRRWKHHPWFIGRGEERAGLAEAHPDMAYAVFVQPLNGLTQAQF